MRSRLPGVPTGSEGGFIPQQADVAAAAIAALAGAPIEPEPFHPVGPPDGLSEREVDVLRLIALGRTNAEIAEQLYLSVRTVETHRAHIQQKLRLGSRSELVRHALDHGLVAT
jgi:DNA-binding NarL/FixJ family response regulator